MKAREAERGVKKLQPAVIDTSHRMFRITCDICGQYLARTHLSHQPGGREIGALASSMARQLGISAAIFSEIVDCSKGWADYRAALGHAHDPAEPVDALS